MIFKKKKKQTENEDRQTDEPEVEKIGIKDKFAMVIAAFLVIMLPCLLIILGISALMLFLFGAL